MESVVDEPSAELTQPKKTTLTLERAENRKSCDQEAVVVKDGSPKPAIIKSSSDPLRPDRITIKLVSNGNRMEPKKVPLPRISFADAISGIEAKHHEIVLQKVSKRKSIQTPLKDFSECEGISGKSPAHSLPKTKRISSNLSTDTDDSSSKEEASKESHPKRKISQTTNKAISDEPHAVIAQKEKKIDLNSNSDTKQGAKEDKADCISDNTTRDIGKSKNPTEDIASTRDHHAGSEGSLIKSQEKMSLLNDSKSMSSDDNDESFAETYSNPRKKNLLKSTRKLSVDKIYQTSSDSDSDSISKSEAAKSSSKIMSTTLPTKLSETLTTERPAHVLERKSIDQLNLGSKLQPLFVDDRLPEGWSRELCQRQGGLTAGKYDVYIRNPTGKKFRSRNEIRNYAEFLGLDLDADDFDFTVFGKFPNTSSTKTMRPLKSVKALNPSSGAAFQPKEKLKKKIVKNVVPGVNEDVAASPYFSSDGGKKSSKNPRSSGTEAPVVGVQKWTPPRSPYNLIQENLYHNPWQLLVATILLNKSTVLADDILGKSATPIIYKFFEKWPTPESLAGADHERLASVIAPLGLQNKRARTIKRFSEEFLTKEWLYPNELHGIGKYGNDSFRMFCINEWKSVKPYDPMLTLYKNWLSINWRYLSKGLSQTDNS